MKPEAAPQSVLAIDIGGTNVKVLASGQDRPRRIASGPKLTPNTMVALVKELVADWEFDVIAVGYPGRVVDGRIVGDPRHLATGWVGFDFALSIARSALSMTPHSRLLEAIVAERCSFSGSSPA